MPRHTGFCRTQLIQVTSTSRPSYGMVEARRLVTAGHGPVPSGRPRSRRSRPVTSLLVVGPAARAPTACHVAHGSLASRSEAIALLGTARLVRSSLPRFGSVAADETSPRP